MFELLLSRLGRELDRVGIGYMVIGGQAVQLYGEPRLTRDIDLTLGLGPDGLDRILGVCRELGLKVLPADAGRFVRDTLVLPALEESSGIRVDFIFSFSEYEQQAIGRSRPVDISGVGVRFAALEDLIIHKLVAGRPRDLEDVRTVLVRNPGTDHGYVERWLGEFERLLNRPLLATFRQLAESLQ